MHVAWNRREAARQLLQYGTRADLFGEPQRVREQVPFVVLAELLARDGERRAGQAGGEQADVPERAAVHLSQVRLGDC